MSRVLHIPQQHMSQSGTGTTLVLRCPSCRHRGTLVGTPINDLSAGGMNRLLGLRRCPNDACNAVIFFVYDTQARSLVDSYPPKRVDFDTTSVPQPVVAALEEAITCHATGCFTAGAIMVRKTLEVLCDDRKATGPNLKERIKALGSAVVLPTELLDGLDDLRLLGNDAATSPRPYE